MQDRKLKKTSARKASGGKSYYVLCDDIPSLEATAMLRGYKPITKKVIKNGKEIQITVSLVTQLLNDN